MDRRPPSTHDRGVFTNFTGRNDATVDGQKERQQPANTRHVGDVGGGATPHVGRRPKMTGVVIRISIQLAPINRYSEKVTRPTNGRKKTSKNDGFGLLAIALLSNFQLHSYPQGDNQN